jgi:hypothetical protein
MSNVNQKANVKELDVDVLYQKLGDRWFAFSLVGDEVFMAPISEEQVNGVRTDDYARKNLSNHEAA